MSQKKPPKKSLGRLRLEAGLSQRQAADRAQTSSGRWSEWETGRVRPAPGHVRAIAIALGCSVSDVCDALGIE